MAPQKQYTSPEKPNNQPDFANDFLLLQLDNQKLEKEVQDLKQITQSLMLIINNLIYQQNPKQEIKHRLFPEKWKSGQVKLNGIQDKILTRVSIQWNIPSSPNDKIRSQRQNGFHTYAFLLEKKIRC